MITKVFECVSLKKKHQKFILIRINLILYELNLII
jgi:hypothetical protein